MTQVATTRKEFVRTSDDKILEDYAYMVKRIGRHLMARLPNSVQLDDLLQAGMMGLLEAAKNYDASKGASFETYAGIRIRGTMLDEVRRGDWVPRSVHRNAREVSAVVQKLENDLGRDARDHEVAEALGVSIKDYHKMLSDMNAARLIAFEDISLNGDFSGDHFASDAIDPFDGVRREDFINALVNSINALPDREQLVLSLYYEEEMNLKEIGEILSVSESRVSQIHSQAMLRLRSRLPDYKTS